MLLLLFTSYTEGRKHGRKPASIKQLFNKFVDQSKRFFKIDKMVESEEFFNDIDVLIQQFLIGTKLNSTLPESTGCVDSSRDLAIGMEKSIDSISENGFNRETYLSLAGSIGLGDPTIKNCFNTTYKGYKQTAEHLSGFDGVVDFIGKFALNAGYSFLKLYNVTLEINKATEKGNKTEQAYLYGKLTYILLDFDGNLTRTDNLNAVEASNSFFDFVWDLVYNFFDGAVLLEAEEIESCGKNATALRTNIEYAIDEFKKHTEEGLYNGVYAIADQFSLFKSVNEVCLAGYDSIMNQVNRYELILTAPMEIFFNIVWNYRKVYKFMIEGIECLFNWEAKCMGFNAGRLVYQVFYKHR